MSVSGPTFGGARRDHHRVNSVSLTSTTTASAITGIVHASGTTKIAMRMPVTRITPPLSPGMGRCGSADLLEPAFAQGTSRELRPRGDVEAFEQAAQVRFHGPRA